MIKSIQCRAEDTEMEETGRTCCSCPCPSNEIFRRQGVRSSLLGCMVSLGCSKLPHKLQIHLETYGSFSPVVLYSFLHTFYILIMPPTTKFAMPRNHHKNCQKMSRSSKQLPATELCHRHISLQIHLCTNKYNIFNHHFLNHITGYH